jgi:hypothetical protein
VSRFNFAGPILQESFTMQATGAAPKPSDTTILAGALKGFGDMQIEPKNKMILNRLTRYEQQLR